MNIYFDNAATTAAREEVIELMTQVMREDYGNPSSTHIMGRRASVVLETARGNLAAAIGAREDEIYFTSGGTEADNWAVFGCAEAFYRRGKHIITSETEHGAISEPIKKLEKAGWEISYLTPDSSGRISGEMFASALRKDTVFASIMLVNNETGAVNPVGEYAKAIKCGGFDTILHTDAVQGLCKIPFSVKSPGADLISVSAHKLHGPKGAGALYIKNSVKLPPFIIGGAHEKGKRAGTVALPAIAGFGEAVRLGISELTETADSVRGIREHVIQRLREELSEAVVIGDGDSPYILSVSLPGYKSEVLMSFLEAEGICVSKSAACKKGARSKVLESMRLKNDVIDGALRVSFSRYNTLSEADYFVEALKKAASQIIK